MTANTTDSPIDRNAAIEQAPAGSENPQLPSPDLFDLERRIRVMENYIATLDDTTSAVGKTAIPYLACTAFGILAAVLAGWAHWPS